MHKTFIALMAVPIEEMHVYNSPPSMSSALIVGNEY